MLKLPTNAELDAMDMSAIVAHFHDGPEIELLSAPSGVEHYRLLAWLANEYVANDIREIGTFRGYGAMCLASHPSNEVTTYDINFENVDIVGFDKKEQMLYGGNIIFEKADGVNDFDLSISQSDIVFVDAWHHGEIEKQIFEHLDNQNFQGLLIFDDIDHDNFPGMRAFWNSIEHPGKVNITHIGHHSGTGLIDFSVKA